MFCFITSTINLDETVKILYNYVDDLYNVNSTILHVGYISVQNMKSHINCLVSYSLDRHMQSFVQTLTWALGESSLHANSLLPHVALFFL